MLIEVRIPTYQRPALLRRALTHLAGQTYENWRAVVLDDGAGEETRAIVDDLGDHRIAYRSNLPQLGLVDNLALAFRPEAFFEESLAACVLEDDNYYRADFLSRCAARLDSRRENVLQVNAQIAQLYESGKEDVEDRTTLGSIYGDTSRSLSYRERLLNIPLNCTMSNSGIVWRLGRGLDFRIVEERWNQLVQEKLRAAVDKGDIWYEAEPLVVFTNFPDRLQHRSKEHNRRWRRSEIELFRWWLREIQRLGIRTNELPEAVAFRSISLQAVKTSQLLSWTGPQDALLFLKSGALVLRYPRPTFKL